MIKRIVIVSFLAIMLGMLLASPAMVTIKAADLGEMVELRDRASRTYQIDTTTRQTVFVGSPEFTQSSVDGSWIEYAFSDYGNFYAVQHPWWSIAFYDYYTIVYDETFTEVKIYDDRWIVEYQNKKGDWIDADFYGITRSYEIVSDGIKLKRTGNTDIGQREEIYYFRNGSPCKIEIKQTCDEAQTIRFVWKPTGIVADTERQIIPDEDDRHTGKVSGLNYYDSAGKFISTLRWYDELDICDSITPVMESSTQGRKATVTFGNFAINAGEIARLDPDTFYPDAHVETSSVDGRVLHKDLEGLDWVDLQGGVGTDAIDDQPAPWAAFIRADGLTNKWDNLNRGIFLFNTEGLPDDADISAATLSLYGSYKEKSLPEGFGLNIYSSNPASNIALVPGDYDSLDTTIYCDSEISYASFNSGGWNNFVLNASGIGAISKTGVTKLGTRESTRDAPNIEPTWSPGGDKVGFQVYDAEQGNGFKPKLVVTYTSSPPPPDLDPRDPDLVYLEFRPDLDETLIAKKTFVPTNVLVGIFHGYSLPVWSSDNETLHFLMCVPDRWNESSDILVHLKVATSDNQVDNIYALELAWNQVTPNVVEAIPTVAPHIINVTRTVDSELQYACYLDWFTLDYDIDAGDPVISNDTIALRVRRVGATDNLTSELIVLEVSMLFARGDLLGNPGNIVLEEEMEEIGIQFGVFNIVLEKGTAFFLGLIFILGLSFLAFWRYTPLLFMLVAGAAVIFGLYWYDAFTTNLGLGLGLMMMVYALVCVAFAFRCIFWRESPGEE